VILDQYHSLKCEEQFFSSNIINVVYIGLKIKIYKKGQMGIIRNTRIHQKQLHVAS